MLAIPAQKLKEALVRDNLITPEDFDKISTEAKRMGQNIADVIISRGFISQDYFYNLLTDYFQVEKADLGNRQVDESALRLLPEDLAKQKGTAVFGIDPNGVLMVAMEDPSNLETIEFIERRLSAKIRPYLATPEDLSRAFAFYGQRIAEGFNQQIEENIRATLRKKVGSVEEAAKDVPIVAIVDNLISYSASL
ncbi:MAG: hypothetical protein NTW60_00115, partial [Candidatus Wolfebacteria bacterium]|nr:hypothetical protein [Candidatus Wolfebacteria bacterium]